MPRIFFATMQNLFEPDASIPKDLLKQDALLLIKQEKLAGVPDPYVQVDLAPEGDSDILVRIQKPEDALGIPTYNGEQNYFDRLEQDLYEPSEEEVA